MEQELRTFEQDQTLERAKALFAATPLSNEKNFSAASMQVLSTEYNYKNNNNLLLVTSALVGLIIGLFYVYISNSLQIQKIRRKK